MSTCTTRSRELQALIHTKQLIQGIKNLLLENAFEIKVVECLIIYYTFFSLTGGGDDAAVAGATNMASVKKSVNLHRGA